jgi:RpiR family carbohydrate utilization transcriptional regulator
MASLDQVHHSLDMSAVNRAVDLLTQAKKIAFLASALRRPSLMTR